MKRLVFIFLSFLPITLFAGPKYITEREREKIKTDLETIQTIFKQSASTQNIREALEHIENFKIDLKSKGYPFYSRNVLYNDWDGIFNEQFKDVLCAIRKAKKDISNKDQRKIINSTYKPLYLYLAQCYILRTIPYIFV